jgi:hypothetical protein
MQYHKWSLNEIENLIPWEREIYVLQLEQYIKEENQKLQTQSNSMMNK